MLFLSSTFDMFRNLQLAKCRILLAVIAVVFTAPVIAQINQINLSNYQVSGSYLLEPADFTQNPAILNAHEVSAVTYNWDNNTLFVVGDEGGNILEVSLTGETISKMAIFGFNDPEGLTYVGNNTIVMVEERNRDAYQINYVASSFLFKNANNAIDLGSFVDNIGLEGISYDPRDGSFVTVKEKTPQQVNVNTLNFNTFSAVISPLFVPNLGVADIADVQVLATVPALFGTSDEDNLLLFSQESSMLLKVDRLGNVLGQFDFSGLSSTAEGVTIDPMGTIYVVAENGTAPTLYVLKPTIENMDEDIPFLPWWALVSLGALFGVKGFKRAGKKS